MIWFDFVSCVLCIMWAMQAANQAGAWVAKRPNSHAHCVFPCCVTPPSRHQVADVWQDMLVNRSWIIYSVIHFTIPSWDCKLLQSCYFKPSFPTWGCRLPSFLPVRHKCTAMCPGRSRVPRERFMHGCGYCLVRFFFLLSYKTNQSKNNPCSLSSEPMFIEECLP